MKKKFFYSHLTETTEISLKLGDMELSQEERVHLTSLVEANVHAKVIDTVLSELSEEDKKVFLKNMSFDDHDKTWEHLTGRIEKAEDKIRKAIEEIREEFLKDIEKAQKLSEENKS